MMRTSADINELATALALAQAEIEAAPKDSVNPHFKSRYADLASCWSAARSPLAKYGLALIQSPEAHPDSLLVSVTTRLLHKSGQWIEGELTCKSRSPAAQDIGACITYLRRYGFCAIVGVVSDEDDDGNTASRAKSPERRDVPRGPTPAARPVEQPAPKPGGPFTGTAEQEKIVAQLLEQRGVPAEFWDEIRRNFIGKRLPDLDSVIESVRQQTVGKEDIPF